MTLLLLTGCIAARLTQGTVAAFDPGEPAHAEAHTDLDVGLAAGVFELTLGGHLRSSPQGVELAAVPMGCLAAPVPSRPLGIGGCLGVTLLGGGSHDSRATFLIGGPEAQAYALWAPWFGGADLSDLYAKAQDGEPVLFVRGGLVTGLDVRASGGPHTPYVGAFVGLEMWTALDL